MKERAHISWQLDESSDKAYLSASGTNEVLLTGLKGIFDAIITDVAERNYIPVSVMRETMLEFLKDE
ncbi:hypothetical protein JO41_02090 [Treponema sp. OMZ 838]|uniref:hypothetical protein n=1 Tax=Treponema sp. OMZ 838 TaxID=1539298 RepID=UPI0005301482|nr:hypothetical protein [Treponema sp. OMZ 838]AIW88736.1 hypothetical protein JO41_02090 [Treponema sp. OMZ 838]